MRYVIVDITSQVGPEGKVKFVCKSDQGAVLALEHDATEESLYMGTNIVSEIKLHYKGWEEFVRSADGFGLHPSESIIFISGHVKTGSAWSMAVVTENGKSVTLELDAGQFAHVGAAIDRKKQTSWIQRAWPPKPKPGESSPELTFDHCIFLKYCKVKSWPFAGLVVKGNASPPRSPSPEPSPAFVGSTAGIFSGGTLSKLPRNKGMLV